MIKGVPSPKICRMKFVLEVLHFRIDKIMIWGWGGIASISFLIMVAATLWPKDMIFAYSDLFVIGAYAFFTTIMMIVGIVVFFANSMASVLKTKRDLILNSVDKKISEFKDWVLEDYREAASKPINAT